MKTVCITRKANSQIILGKEYRMATQGLYRLDAHSIIQPEVYTSEQMHQIDQSILWHRRLGHLNFHSLHELSISGAVSGLPKLAEVSTVYDICQLGKQARKKFHHSTSISTTPLQFVHSDVCGPF